MSNRILIVEDENYIQEIIKEYLTSSGFEVIAVEDGMSALKEFTSSAFDLVVLDIMLPRLNGMELLKEIRRISSVPVLMLTH